MMGRGCVSASGAVGSGEGPRPGVTQPSGSRPAGLHHLAGASQAESVGKQTDVSAAQLPSPDSWGTMLADEEPREPIGEQNGSSPPRLPCRPRLRPGSYEMSLVR